MTTFVRPSDEEVAAAVEDAARLPRRSDAEIMAAVAADPDAAPTLAPGELAAKLAVGRARIVRAIDPALVARVRQKLDMSQERFAAVFGVPVATVRNWEQGRRRPEGAARVLLMVIDRNPEAVIEALRAA